MSIQTPRLDLVPGTPAMLRAELQGPHALQAVLGVQVPESWPPEFYDADAVNYTLARVAEHGEPPAWWFHYFVLRATAGHPATAVGAGGYKGPPREGVAEIGYSVLPEHRRRGYAAEAAAGLVAHAFAHPEVSRVIAHTLPELVPSIGVLEKCGFRFAGEAAEEEGAIRYELTRADWRPLEG
jgi:RimJ/RimL family protein N-acetyltransferase